MFSEDRADFIASFNEYDLLIIDDRGVERSTEYAMEQMFFVIDSRYRRDVYKRQDNALYDGAIYGSGRCFRRTI